MKAASLRVAPAVLAAEVSLRLRGLLSLVLLALSISGLGGSVI
ncbi:MAG: hypothetical protein AB7O37_06230 [Vicinamibacteria bacterium]